MIDACYMLASTILLVVLQTTIVLLLILSTHLGYPWTLTSAARMSISSSLRS